MFAPGHACHRKQWLLPLRACLPWHTVCRPDSLSGLPATVACKLSRSTAYDRRLPLTQLRGLLRTPRISNYRARQKRSAGFRRISIAIHKCGILAHGFARARCGECGHDYLIAYSCKGRGVCPSCTTRRMVETAAHLADHVIPRLPVRQWVLSVPKRLRYHLQHDPAVLNAALHIFMSAVERQLRLTSPGASAKSRLGGVVFIHRFGALLNAHLHFHCVVVDGVFDADAAGGVIFHPATELDARASEMVQASVRQRLLRTLERRGQLEPDEAQTMAAWEYGGGFSVDTSVRIEGDDRAGLERLLRYCARPAFALERLREIDPEHLV